MNERVFSFLVQCFNTRVDLTPYRIFMIDDDFFGVMLTSTYWLSNTIIAFFDTLLYGGVCPKYFFLTRYPSAVGLQ